MMKKLFLWISLLLLLTACRPVDNTAPIPVSPTQRVEPSPEPAPVMETAMPTETATPPTAAPESASTPNADVTHVRAMQSADGRWTFHVTVSHPDTGWEDYADGWDVVLHDGTILKVQESDLFTRLLLHPHVDEQPFTRSQSGIIIPENILSVTVRAHDLVDGFGGQEVVVDLTQSAGENFEVQR